MRQVLENVYRQHRQGLFTLALAITRCPERAEDAVHDAFVRLWRSGWPVGNPVTYAYAAVRNAAVDQIRRAAVAARPAASIFNGAAPDPLGEAIAGETQRLVREALEGLAPGQREAIVLRIYGGLTFDEMAEVLGEPLPTVASRYRRGLEALREKVRGLV